MTRYLVDTSAYSAFMRGHEELRNSFQIADIPTNDVWIAASAMQHGLCVLTTDPHFEKVAHRLWSSAIYREPPGKRPERVTSRGGPMTYKVALHHDEEGVSIWVPGLPGCWSQGESEEEALSNIQSAILEYLTVAEELAQTCELREVEVAV